MNFALVILNYNKDIIKKENLSHKFYYFQILSFVINTDRQSQGVIYVVALSVNDRKVLCLNFNIFSIVNDSGFSVNILTYGHVLEWNEYDLVG